MWIYQFSYIYLLHQLTNLKALMYVFTFFIETLLSHWVRGISIHKVRIGWLSGVGPIFCNSYHEFCTLTITTCIHFVHILFSHSIFYRHFTHPDILDRVPVAFLILGGILLALQIIGFILLRPKPLESVSNEIGTFIHFDINLQYILTCSFYLHLKVIESTFNMVYLIHGKKERFLGVRVNSY